MIEVILLGAAQDGGFPQFGCKCENCKLVYKGQVNSDTATSLAVIDHTTSQWWLFDPTPQLCRQWENFANVLSTLDFSGAFITHAHAGHYPGILYFGKEALNCSHLPLYCSESMHAFLSANEPWKVMYTNNNIEPMRLESNTPLQLTANLKVTPIPIEHRADFTDTFCFAIQGESKELLFCPDIDSWDQCAHLSPKSGKEPSLITTATTKTTATTNIEDVQSLQLQCSEYSVAHNWLQTILALGRFDILLLDATFYDNNELKNRDVSKIPHPRVEATVEIVRQYNTGTGSYQSHRDQKEKRIEEDNHSRGGVDGGRKHVSYCAECKTALSEVVLIHLNHSNRLWVSPELVRRLEDEDHIKTGRQGQRFHL